MRKRVDEKTARRQVTWRMFETAHCAQATLYNMHDLVGFDSLDELILSASGLAGGLGHQGAACGAVVGGALVLALLSAERNEADEVAIATGSAYVGEFVRQFTLELGSTQCEDIAEVDFDNDYQVRKFLLVGFPDCLKATSKAASIMASILNRLDPPPDHYAFTLNRGFAEKRFHCAYSVVRGIAGKLHTEIHLPRHMLISLNGGMGYSGSTCTALLGACLAMGLLRGGDTRKGGKLGTLRQAGRMLVQGSAGFRNLEISPAHDALLRCSELVDWFQESFSSHRCREITHTDFQDASQAESYFSQQGVERCMSMAEETVIKACELAS